MLKIGHLRIVVQISFPLLTCMQYSFLIVNNTAVLLLYNTYTTVRDMASSLLLLESDCLYYCAGSGGRIGQTYSSA